MLDAYGKELESITAELESNKKNLVAKRKNLESALLLPEDTLEGLEQAPIEVIAGVKEDAVKKLDSAQDRLINNFKNQYKDFYDKLEELKIDKELLDKTFNDVSNKKGKSAFLKSAENYMKEITERESARKAKREEESKRAAEAKSRADASTRPAEPSTSTTPSEMKSTEPFTSSTDSRVGTDTDTTDTDTDTTTSTTPTTKTRPPVTIEESSFRIRAVDDKLVEVVATRDELAKQVADMQAKLNKLADEVSNTPEEIETEVEDVVDSDEVADDKVELSEREPTDYPHYDLDVVIKQLSSSDFSIDKPLKGTDTI